MTKWCYNILIVEYLKNDINKYITDLRKIISKKFNIDITNNIIFTILPKIVTNKITLFRFRILSNNY